LDKLGCFYKFGDNTLLSFLFQALAYLSEAEALAKQFDEGFWPRGVLFRAHALVQLKQAKAFKRDMKSAGLTPDQTTIYEFFRSNLEYCKVCVSQQLTFWHGY